jgi:hypothetical protein
VRVYKKKLRVEIGAHALRAPAATNALEHEADIAKAPDWLGHANIATTRLYDRRNFFKTLPLVILSTLIDVSRLLMNVTLAPKASKVVKTFLLRDAHGRCVLVPFPPLRQTKASRQRREF